jgi:hypothetical protein
MIGKGGTKRMKKIFMAIGLLFFMLACQSGNSQPSEVKNNMTKISETKNGRWPRWLADASGAWLRI